jgi:hypothetical protein
MNTAYCILHEHSVLVQQSLVGECHEYPTFDEFGRLEYDWCFFNCGMTVMEEPEYDSDWELNLVEPDEEEETPNLDDLEWFFNDERIRDEEKDYWSFGSPD